MKVLYLTIWNFDKKESDGVAKKILQQVETFRNSGIETDYTYILKNEKKVCINVFGKEEVLGKYRGSKGIGSCLILKDYLKKNSYQGIYIRNFGRIDPWVVGLLKLLHNQGCRILYEFPTFPYDRELTSNFFARIDLGIDRIFRKQIKKYVDRVVTFSPDEKIYGIPTIQTMNGIIVDEQKMVCNDKKDDFIRLLAVAIFQRSHGYERVIKGMADYKKHGGKRIILYLVGDGPEKKNYMQLSAKLGVDDIVKFYPKMAGKGLDDMYELADISLIDFGAYRENIYVTSALKSREALAKGLPLMTGCKIDICEKQYFPYVLEYPNDSSDLDLFRVEEFYKAITLGKSKTELAKEIRQYAKENLDMSITMKPIVDYIERGNK